MLVRAVKTRKILPPKDDLLSVIKESVSVLHEKSILVVTSKVVSIWEARCIKIEDVKSKEDLVKQEADFYLNKNQPDDVMLTIKSNILIPTSGIDESNANGYYILWPKKPFLSAKTIYEFVKKTYKLKKFGIIISDSHTTPLRKGIMGIALAYYGFGPLRDYRGKKDIFGRKLKMSQTNIVDSLAAAAVYEMGEGSETTPLAIISDLPKIDFALSRNPAKDLMRIPLNQDIYAPLLKVVKWKNK